MRVDKPNIRIIPENCSNCLSCMLICSFTHFKSFNPSQSHIRVVPGHFENNEWIQTDINYLSGCKPDCWLCAQYCAYGALEHIGES